MAELIHLPLRTFDIVLVYIRGNTTTIGLTVNAFQREGVDEKGQGASNSEMEKLNLERHAVCPNWNYTIRPHQDIAPET